MMNKKLIRNKWRVTRAKWRDALSKSNRQRGFSALAEDLREELRAWAYMWLQTGKETNEQGTN